MMDSKRALTNRVFCPMPWTGLMYNFDGSVKNCIRSSAPIGNIKDDSIENILTGPVNQHTQSEMLSDRPGPSCHPCYGLEQNKKSFDIISDRIFYIRELKKVPFETYQQGTHELNTIDVRWTNLCNFSCVYCGPEFSSRWASEIQIYPQTPSAEQVAQFKEYIFSHAKTLKHVYMAGGEPLLMKENLELLDILEKDNPEVNLRINTNLSKVDTKVFEKICGFKNVHWTVSLDEMQQQFEYVRYGASWEDFVSNLDVIKKLNHKISFNMLYFLLNYQTLFDTIDFLRDCGYHPNSFIIGPLLTPVEINVRHLPDAELMKIQHILETRIGENPGYLLEDSYRNLLNYIRTPLEKNLKQAFDFLSILDKRRGLKSSDFFPELYQFKE
jgi:MoaA/NifB/PqqE/SkfB family radical SAM enzyme